MLVISRKRGERIVIAGNISVEVLDLGKGRVKLGVHAPLDVPVHREEILARIEARAPALECAGCA